MTYTKLVELSNSDSYYLVRNRTGQQFGMSSKAMRLIIKSRRYTLVGLSQFSYLECSFMDYITHKLPLI